MPITSSGISQAINTQFKLNNFFGRDISVFASAIGSAVQSNLIRPNMVTCSLSGTVGPFGNITSTIVIGIVPTAMSSLMLSKAVTKSFKGRDIRTLFNAISNGLALNMYQMILSGKAAGIAMGAGLGTFTALSENIMSNEMVFKMRSKGIKGRDIKSLCDCISFGVVNHLKTSVKFQVLVSGTVAPVPPAGPLAAVGIPSIYTKIR